MIIDHKHKSKNIILSFLASVLVVSLIWFALDALLTEMNDPIETLNQIWSDDLATLSKEKKLSPKWQEIKSVELVAANEDETAAAWIKKIRAPIHLDPKGKYKIEILFISQTDENQIKAVVLHKLVEITSNNLIWELDRTYHLK